MESNDSNNLKKQLISKKRQHEQFKDDEQEMNEQEDDQMQEQNIMDFNQIPKEKREAFEGEQENDQDWEDNDGADVNVDFQFYDPSPDHFHAV